MKKNKVPSAPSYYQDPNLSAAIQSLLTGGFLNQSGDALSFLNPLVSLNPQMTQQSIQLALHPLQTEYDQTYKNLLSTLEANNQLTSSVTGNKLGDLQRLYTQQVGDIGTQFSLADEQRAMQNLGSLFGEGLQYGSNNQNAQNQFNLQNYQNQLTQYGLSQKGGLMGGLTGGLGGILGGSALGPIGAILGGVGGAFGGALGSPGTGGSLLNAGSLLYGLQPNRTASNNPFGNPSPWSNL